MKIKANVSILDILGHFLIWFLIMLITLGLGAFFFPYSFAKFIINRTDLVDENGVSRRMVCQTNPLKNIPHILLWVLITLCTLGLGYFLYFY